MANPAVLLGSAHTWTSFKTCHRCYAGGVHINSSIPNRALYLLAEGLSNAVGRSVAEQIAYQTLLALTPTSDFQDG